MLKIATRTQPLPSICYNNLNWKRHWNVVRMGQCKIRMLRVMFCGHLDPLDSHWSWIINTQGVKYRSSLPPPPPPPPVSTLRTSDRDWVFRPASCQLDKVGEVLVSYLTLTAWSGQIFTFELCNHQLYYELRDCFVSSLISRSSLLSYSGQSLSQSVS